MCRPSALIEGPWEEEWPWEPSVATDTRVVVPSDAWYGRPEEMAMVPTGVSPVRQKVGGSCAPHEHQRPGAAGIAEQHPVSTSGHHRNAEPAGGVRGRPPHGPAVTDGWRRPPWRRARGRRRRRPRRTTRRPRERRGRWSSPTMPKVRPCQPWTTSRRRATTDRRPAPGGNRRPGSTPATRRPPTPSVTASAATVSLVSAYTVIGHPANPVVRWRGADRAPQDDGCRVTAGQQRHQHRKHGQRCETRPHRPPTATNCVHASPQ